MILVWLVFAAMTLATAVLLALPLFYTRKVKNESVFALAVYRDQMLELGRDCEAGLIAPDQAKSAQIEIERRVLALTESPQWQPGRAPSHGLTAWLDAWDPNALILEANPRYLSNPAAVRWMKARGRPVIIWGLGAPPISGFMRGALQ